MSYKTSMEAFQYCPVRNCAIKRDTSTIASGESFNCKFAKCRFTDDLIEIPHKIEFDLVHQVSFHVCPNICGLLGDENGTLVLSGRICQKPQLLLLKHSYQQPSIISTHVQHHLVLAQAH